MNGFLDAVLFTLGVKDFTLLQILLFSLLLLLVVITPRIINKVFARFSTDNKPGNIGPLLSLLKQFIWLLFLLLSVLSLDLNYAFTVSENFNPSISIILKTLVVLQLLRILDWVVNHLFIERYYGSADNQTKKNKLNSVRKTVHYISYCLLTIYFLRQFNLDYVLSTRTIGSTEVRFTLSKIFTALFIIFLAQLFIWVITEIILRNIYKNKFIDYGSQFAVNQLVKYVLYVFAFVYALDILGINMTLLLGGAAALLVGVGLGLQSTFNDFISGIVLLFERSVSVGDVLEFEDTVGTVKKIGLRSSIVETRENISIIVPNHLLVNNKVLNWTHVSDKVRFYVDIGVAYGSDTELVKRLLIEAVSNNPYVSEYPSPIVRFENFGESALDFKIYFFSRNYAVIEDIKSDIRFEIDRLFRENNVTIPFPQRDINIRPS